ncbi:MULTISPECIES: MerR family transcriptional regulator [unclassified Curtobacterium]|uniref:transcriptional regulator FtsR n=1 Tax=unclassified Curtobacterium TaxID=257496 RepID=UPI000824185F|nr:MULTISPECIES: MerR family transcriptional regulator [unclassified Curtobacterium]WIB01343.1 MerR family transcriptional regulator [Curtobacterium sp. MCBA15_012]
MAGRSAAALTGAAVPDLLTIGQVLARLKPEFPDLSSSKLRFLEERELVTPVRTASGYRKFSAADVDRLRIVLGLQRDHYLPLKVIKDYLADLDAGRDPVLPGGGDAPKPSILGRERRYTRDETVRAAGASPMLLSDAVSASLLPAADTYTDDAVAVLKALVDLQRTGIEPRHLRSMRGVAEREVGLIESALMPVSRRGDATSRAKATEMAREIAAQLEVIRSSLIRSAIGRLDA